MADNVTLDPGTGGASVATDDAGAGGHVQIIKLAISADGSATVIPADATNGLDVDVTRLPSGTVAGSSSLPAGTNNIGDVDVLTLPANASVNQAQVAGTATDTNSGNKSAGTQRVVLATDQPQLTAALKVDGSAVTQPVSGTVTANAGSGTMAVSNAGTFASQESGAALTALQLIDDTVIADDAAFAVGTTKVNVAGFLADQASTDSVNEGDAGAARMTLDRKQIVTVAPSADTEGLSISRSLDLNTTDVAVKASAGKVYGWYIYNDGAAEAYVKLYNDTTANVTVGSTTPVMTIPIPAGAAANVEFTNGIAFSTAITAAATTLVADNDATAPTANQVVANFFYQ